MAPEYGATCGIFPIDAETMRYLELSGRAPAQIALVEAYARAQGMFRETGGPEADYSDHLEARPRAMSSQASRAQNVRKTASACAKQEATIGEALSVNAGGAFGQHRP